MTLAALPAAMPPGVVELATTTAPVASSTPGANAGDVADLVVAVELVAAQVEQHEHDGRTCAATRPTTPRHLQSAGAPAGPAAMQQPGPRACCAHRLVTPGDAAMGAARPAARSLVVVVLPLVPETSTTGGRRPTRQARRGRCEDGVPPNDRTRPAPAARKERRRRGPPPPPGRDRRCSERRACSGGAGTARVDLRPRNYRRLRRGPRRNTGVRSPTLSERAEPLHVRLHSLDNVIAQLAGNSPVVPLINRVTHLADHFPYPAMSFLSPTAWRSANANTVELP